MVENYEMFKVFFSVVTPEMNQPDKTHFCNLCPVTSRFFIKWKSIDGYSNSIAHLLSKL